MQNIKTFLLSVLVLVCAAAMIFPCTAAVAVGSASQNAQSYNPDYSNPATEAVVELTPSEFTELLAGETLSEAEKTYIDNMLIGSPFRYSNVISPKCVQTVYDNNTLNITAEVYSYTAVNGCSITWIPKNFLLVGADISGALTHNAESGLYTATVNELMEDTVTAIKLTYSCAISVKGEEADIYINYAYRYAKTLDAQQKDYEGKLSAYETAYEKYQAYLIEKAAYDKALASYNKYLEDKAAYDKKYAEYTKYQEDMKIYRENKAAYDAYLAAQAKYESDKAAYDAAYNAASNAYIEQTNKYNADVSKYNTYLGELDKILDCMATIDNVFVANSQGKMLYATLIGNTVDTVVSNKALLVSQGGCDAALIDQAGNSTNVLRSLMTEYHGKQTRAEKLAYYQEHYEEIKENFFLLYQALSTLINKDVAGTSADRVIKVLQQNDKYERYIEFIVQLYTIHSGLDDTLQRNHNLALVKTFDKDKFAWVERTVNTELEPIQRPADRDNADPTGLSCPAEVKEPTKPTFVFNLTEPTAPTAVPVPMEPDPVNEPTAPTEVSKPAEVAEVPAVLEKDKPAPPSFSANEKALLTEYSGGALKERATEEKLLSFETELQKPVSLLNKRHVEFYDYDGKTLLHSKELEMGERIIYPYDTPTREETQREIYSFAGWKDADGNIVDELGTAEDIYTVFYASYTSVIKQYEVTWVIGETSYSKKYEYGTVPVFSETPEKEENAQYSYSFAGWRTEDGEESGNTLPPVVENIKYEAIFQPILRYYTVTWVWGEDGKFTASETLAYGALPECKQDTYRPEDDKFTYVFKAWNTEPAAVTGDATYTAVYEATPIITATGSDGEMVLVTDGDTYKVNIPSDGLRVDRLFELAVLRDKRIELSLKGKEAMMTLNEAMIANLAQAGCTDISLKFNSENVKSLNVIFANASGEAVELTTPITLQYFSATEYTKVYGLSSDGTLVPMLGSVEGNTLTMKLSKSETVVFRDEYAVEVIPLENGMLSVDIAIAYEGQTVKLTPSFSDEYKLSFLKVVGKISGEEYTVAPDGSFSMPAEPVAVSGGLELKEFTVKFVVEGVVVSEKIYHMGDKVELPDDPQKDANGDTVYTFSGWTPTITSVSADATYTAVFTETVKRGTDMYIPPDVQDNSYILYLEISAVLLVLAALITTPIVLVICRKKRKKKAQRQNNTEE